MYRALLLPEVKCRVQSSWTCTLLPWCSYKRSKRTAGFNVLFLAPGVNARYHVMQVGAAPCIPSRSPSPETTPHLLGGSGGSNAGTVRIPATKMIRNALIGLHRTPTVVSLVFVPLPQLGPVPMPYPVMSLAELSFLLREFTYTFERMER